MSETYNGWMNYETWLVNVWLDNEQGSYDYLMEMAREAQTNRETARAIQEYVEEMIDLSLNPSNGLAADLVNSALGSVHWEGIAEGVLEAVVEEESDDV